MVPGSTTTTMPVTSCCSSNSAVVMTGTMSSASLSSPDSSATTTSRRLDENTALYASGCISEGMYVSMSINLVQSCYEVLFFNFCRQKSVFT